MKDGFIKVCAATTTVSVACVSENVKQIINKMKEANGKKAKIVVFQELSLTGYSCGDLFFQNKLLSDCLKGLDEIVKFSKGLNLLTIVGLPFEYKNKIYNTAAVIFDGMILGLVPKTHIPNYSELYEARYFTKAMDENVEILVNGELCLFGPKMLFECENIPGLKVAVEICEDLWAPNSPSTDACLNGATIVCNLSGSNEVVGKAKYRLDLIKMQSSKLICGYIYANSGLGESTQDMVFSGHNIICEDGLVLAQNKLFTNDSVYSEIDLEKINIERAKMSTFISNKEEYDTIMFELNEDETSLTRKISASPFIPESEEGKYNRAEEILTIQAQGLKRRIEHVDAKSIVLGISGGLDSCLAILVMVRAMDLLKRDRKDIIAVSMPCFGTSKRTKSNAEVLAIELGVTFKEIDIKEATKVHLRDIDHSEDIHDVTYENAQARERTQILMDISNKYNGFVVGTGDLSELALGWATYNGDHMSMYGVNAGIPKTLVRLLVSYEAHKASEKLASVLYDILDTPVSPELLPPSDGKISQKTEDLVGPYELHDFFLYYIVRYGFKPKKVYRLAKYAFNGKYTDEVIKKWLRNFYYRFFAQQFKRSCLPDGPKVGSVSLSPRGDFRMPSDALSKDFLSEVDSL